jgi:hypothetical protein
MSSIALRRFSTSEIDSASLRASYKFLARKPRFVPGLTAAIGERQEPPITDGRGGGEIRDKKQACREGTAGLLRSVGGRR